MLGIWCVSVIVVVMDITIVNVALPAVQLLDPNPPEHVHARVREAAHVCPSGAIGLVE